MSKLADTSFLQLLPDSLKTDPDAIAAASSLGSRTLFKGDMEKTLVLFNPETLHERDEMLLNYLFNQEHVDFMDTGITNEEKARLIFMSPAVHMRKGTSWAVQEILRTFYKNAEMTEWFQYNGKPYHFKIRILDNAPSLQEIPRLIRMIFATKNLRSVLEGIYFKDENDVSFGIEYKDNNIRIFPLLDFYCGIGMPGNSKTVAVLPNVSDILGKGVISQSNELRCGEKFSIPNSLGDIAKAHTTVVAATEEGVYRQKTIEMTLNASASRPLSSSAVIGGASNSYSSSLRQCGDFVAEKNKEGGA